MTKTGSRVVFGRMRSEENHLLNEEKQNFFRCNIHNRKPLSPLLIGRALARRFALGHLSSEESLEELAEDTSEPSSGCHLSKPYIEPLQPPHQRQQQWQ